MNTSHITHHTSHITHHTSHITLMLLLMAGCTEQDNLETREQAVVFGQRNVEATRGLFELIRDSSLEQELAYNLAALSRANATITLEQLDRSGSCDPTPEGPGGTLFMTSDTRALSAFHVIRTDRSVYNVQFEGPSGRMLPDTSGYTKYDTKHEWRTDLRYDNEGIYPQEEEYPFLANRLFALGLANWANTNGGLARDRLRTGWQFEVESIPLNDTHHVQQTLWGQGFLPLLPTSGGKDIVLLKARQLDPPNWYGMKPFPLTSPSVFFDQVEVAKPEYGFLDKDDTVEAVYTSPFVGRGLLVPSGCVNGDYLGDSADVGNYVCPGENLTPQHRSFNQLHRTSLDSAVGTSGGAIIGPHRMRVGDGQNPYRWRQAFGVLHGATGIDPPSDWGTPNPSAGEFSTAFTAIGQDWRKTNRDGPTPTVPAPIFGDNDQHPGCTSWKTHTHEVDGQSHSGKVCVEWGESTVMGTVTNGLTPPVEEPEENGKPNIPHHNSYFKVLCHSHYPVQTEGGIQIQSDPGAVVGLLGALHRGVVDNRYPQSNRVLRSGVSEIVAGGGGIGSFFQVCGPHSSIPFTSNWRFLEISGNTIDPSWETLKGPIGWGSLRRALVTKFEERGGTDDSYFRPPSFKTCPPGYLVHGFTLGKTKTHYTSVEQLICVLPNGTGEVRVSTVAEPASSFDAQLFGRKFSLTQMIGVPGGSSDITLVECPANFPLLRGLNMAHDAFGRLYGVEPICVVKVVP